MQAAIAKAFEYAAPSYTAGELKSAETALTELMETVAADGIDLEAEVLRKERDPSVANLYRLFQIVSATTSYSSLPESELIIELFSIAILNGYERSSAAYLPRVALAEEKAGATAIEGATRSKAAALADNLERRLDDLSNTSMQKNKLRMPRCRCGSSAYQCVYCGISPRTEDDEVRESPILTESAHVAHTPIIGGIVAETKRTCNECGWEGQHNRLQECHEGSGIWVCDDCDCIHKSKSEDEGDEGNEGDESADDSEYKSLKKEWQRSAELYGC
jgi:hypothetical protein